MKLTTNHAKKGAQALSSLLRPESRKACVTPAREACLVRHYLLKGALLFLRISTTQHSDISTT